MADTEDKKPHLGLTRRDFLTGTTSTAALGALGLHAVTGEAAQALAKAARAPGFKGRHPNILILMCDEMRHPPFYETDEARAFRRQYLKTQNALRAHGMEFHRHYAASVACVPSRTSIYTGHYPSLHGVTQTTGAAKESFDPDVFWLAPNSVPTIGHYFRAAGYSTFWKGKWHASDADLNIPGTHSQLLSYDPNTGVPDPGLESLYLEADQLGRYGFSGWIGPEPHGRLPLNSGSSAADTAVNGRDIGFASQTKSLIEQLDRKRGNQPWLIVASFVNPHDITLYGLAATLSGKFDFHLQEGIVPVNLLEPMPAGPTHLETLANKPSCQASYRDAYHSVFQPILFDERYVRIYYQLQKDVDEQMMRVYQALQDSRFRDNTLVIFTSDHGDLLGAHGNMHQKWYMAYEEAIHVPLIISSPRLFPEPESVDSLTSHIDLLPTLLGLAGLNAEYLRKKLAPDFSDAEPLVGRNLAPIVYGEVSPDAINEPLYFMTDDDPSRGLNQDNWTGIPYNSVIQPNHIETVIARLNGKIWKYSRYFDNPQFWSTPGDPDADPPPDLTPQDVVVTPPDEPPPSTEGIYTIEYAVSVKTQPLPDEFEMYNVTDDPGELNNLYDQGYPEQAILEKLLAEQCAQKRLTPVSGTVPGQPSC
ncbi:sulfatase-like hydrolase/transferase [Methylocaldum gracile]|nr:twin-arginine translocation signal domain-containing protein [Methylocaldum sp. BRCS4]